MAPLRLSSAALAPIKDRKSAPCVLSAQEPCVLSAKDMHASEFLPF